MTIFALTQQHTQSIKAVWSWLAARLLVCTDFALNSQPDQVTMQNQLQLFADARQKAYLMTARARLPPASFTTRSNGEKPYIM